LAFFSIDVFHIHGVAISAKCLPLLGEASDSSDCGAALGGEDHTVLASLEVARARGEKMKFLKIVFYLLREKGK
jgi:hypothetical protein